MMGPTCLRWSFRNFAKCEFCRLSGRFDSEVMQSYNNVAQLRHFRGAFFTRSAAAGKRHYLAAGFCPTWTLLDAIDARIARSDRPNQPPVR
jgi:hypothetical protein